MYPRLIASVCYRLAKELKEVRRVCCTYESMLIILGVKYSPLFGKRQLKLFDFIAFDDLGV